jgi:hypothetical protein
VVAEVGESQVVVPTGLAETVIVYVWASPALAVCAKLMLETCEFGNEMRLVVALGGVYVSWYSIEDEPQSELAVEVNGIFFVASVITC